MINFNSLKIKISLFLCFLAVGCISRNHVNLDLCPEEMALVFDPPNQIQVCVDRYEYADNKVFLSKNIDQKPLGFQSYYSCEKICKSQNKRLLTHKEWQAACRGTRLEHCNKFREHPLLRLTRRKNGWKYLNYDCTEEKHLWLECMKDPIINELDDGLAKNSEFHECVSEAGVHHMVGNLGEWVYDLHVKKGKTFGRFDGGLYPQKQSSCHYTTVAHGPKYSDYSTGCRCGKDMTKPRKKKPHKRPGASAVPNAKS